MTDPKPYRDKAEFQTSRRTIVASALATAGIAGVAGRAGAQDATPVAEPDTRISPVISFPTPDSRTASPGTQIVFRGLPAANIGAVVVTGSRSGDHTGIWIAHADGNGASLVRDRPFIAGETVTVATRMDVRNGNEGDFTFTVAVPKLKRIEPPSNEKEIEGTVSVFRSRPGLRPPIVSTEGPNGTAAEGLLFLAPKSGAGRNGAMIARQSGEPVWFLPVSVADQRIYDLKVQNWRGQPCLTWWDGLVVRGFGYGHYLIANNRYEIVNQFRAGNEYIGGDFQEFVITPQETGLIIVNNVISWDLSEVGGSSSAFAVDSIVQELEIESGAVLYEWHSLDAIPLTDSQVEVTGEDDEELDYCHVNSATIDFDGSIVISARNIWSIHKLHRSTAEVIWTLGGTGNDFAGGEAIETAWQNDVRTFPGNIYSVFDNGAVPKVHDESRGLRLALDPDGMTAEVQSAFTHPDEILSRREGSMQALPNDNVLIGWGNVPVISEFAKDGALIQDWTIPEGRETYRAFKFPWIGVPAEEPRLVIERDENEALNGYVSWNGDTETKSWRLLAGAAEDALEVRATVERTGFETTIPVSANDLFFAAEALDANGNASARSNVVAIAD